MASARLEVCAGLCVLTVVCLWLSPAQAAPPRVALHYELGDGAGDCPTRQSLRAKVSERLGYDPFRPASSGAVEVRIRARGARYTGAVKLVGLGERLDGERRVQAEVRGCDELIDALALTVSLALDPDAVDRVKRPRRGRDMRVGARPRWGPVSRPAPRPLAPLKEASAGELVGGGWAMSARTGLVAGTSPGVSPLAQVGVSYRGPSLGAGLELRAELPTPVEREGGEVGGNVLAVAATGCVRWGVLRGCAVATVGALMLHSDGVLNARSTALFYGSAGARMGLSLPLSTDLSLEGVLDMEVPMVRARVRLGDTIVWRAERLHGLASVGIAWRL